MIASMLPNFPTEGLQNGATVFGGGTLNPSMVSELQKALNAGPAGPAVGGGSALQIQNLERTLRTTTFTLENIQAWKKIPKVPATATTHEYNLIKQYGGDNGAFTNGGELPQLSDALYQRRVAIIKYLAVQREVVHPMLMVRPAHDNVVGLETKNGTVLLLEQMERALFHGNSAVIPQEFDGIDAQLFADPDFFPNNVIDLRGQHPTEEDIEEGVNIIVENYGKPSLLFMMPRTISELSRSFYNRQRIALPSQGDDGTIGYMAKKFNSSAGLIEFCPDVFLRPGRRNGNTNPPTAATSPLAPPAPSALTVSAASSTGSKFDATTAGSYQYWVTAVNRFGESAAITGGGAVAYLAGESRTITPTSGGGTTTGFKIYRSLKGSTVQADAQLIRSVPLASPSYLDENYILPGYGRGYLMQGDVGNWSFAMLAPMFKIPLATIALSIRWVQAIYGTPIIYSPLKNVCYLNVPDTKSDAVS